MSFVQEKLWVKINQKDYLSCDLPIKKELLKLFEKDQPLKILDIGGCEGEDSIKYSRLFPNSQIFVFEPLPANQNIILENLRKLNLANISLIPFAVSDELGKHDFYVSSGEPKVKPYGNNWNYGNKSSSLLPPYKHLETTPWIEFKEVISVPTITLKTFLSQHNITEIDFIHMDVQGAELKVLKGANSFIKRIKVFWIEVSNIELYKNQPVRSDIEIFMSHNDFYLAKTILDGETGDQLYLNRRYFKQTHLTPLVDLMTNNFIF